MIALVLSGPLFAFVAWLIHHEHKHAGEPGQYREHFQHHGIPTGRPGFGW
jgi:hypothetical protein